jgi:preprotein translocase subunit SecF
LALFVGIATGTYSSVFIATPLLADLREREPEMIALRKRVLARRANPAAGPAPRPARGQRGRGQAGQADDGSQSGQGGAATAVLDRPTAGAAPEPEVQQRSSRAARPATTGQRSQPARKKSPRPKGKKR